ncbi:MAG: T9SS type A sorting domain-containing protein [Bacteroidetes bacterium]|nr:T9SS type A sorting domain-containing protein [Bacteroidota bacterium]
MKRVIFALGILLFLAPILVKCQPKTVVKLKTSYFKFDLPDIGVEGSNSQGIGGALTEATSGSILYSLNGVEHIIGTPAYSTKDLSPLHFVNKDGNWKFEKYYTDVLMGNARNYVFVDSSTIAYADHGRENGNPWPYGNIYTVKTQGDSLKWIKISQYKSFYHSVAVGDINNDNKYDLIGLHMGSYNPWKGNNGLHAYLQQQDGGFSDGVSTIEEHQPYQGTGSVLIADVMGDSRPEIIEGTYGTGFTPFAFSIYSYDKDKNKYVYNKSPKETGVFKDGQQGSTSIKLADFNNDGKIDLAIASEGYPGNRIQIWNGQGNGDFLPGQVLHYDTTLSDGSMYSLNEFREFEIADVNKDGWLDILVHPFHFGNKFRINPGGTAVPGHSNNVGTGVRLNYSIWMNKVGKFATLDDDLQVPNVFPGFIKGFFVNGKLKFFGFEQAQDNNNLHAVKIQEMTVYFCETLTKPIFNTTKFSFCSGDSLKLTVSNINKGDSLKWYYGAKSDLTNVSNKSFTDSTKLFVTRTDSVGCVISSDTIQLKKLAIPNAPSISRDTANFLLSSTTVTTWYKDGAVISDTTQKIKSTAQGSYAVKTTQNGCVSALSNAYYYLVTDVINLNANEFIKLAPNPFANQLNFDFVIKGYQRLNLEVFDIATGTKVASKQNLTPGMPIYLGQLSAGTYVIKVSSTDNKMSYQFKMVKL